MNLIGNLQKLSMNSYKILNQQIFETNNVALVPIRMDDRYTIMRWRNEQMYHLRQTQLLTYESQDAYFSNVINPSFSHEKPSQILFSLLENNSCIGYGGLVHINWIDKNAEISFIMDTKLESDSFELYWSLYLELIEKVAFRELQFHKIFTYAFDIRSHLYTVLEQCGFTREAELVEHCLFDNKYINVVIHSKLNN